MKRYKFIALQVCIFTGCFFVGGFLSLYFNLPDRLVVSQFEFDIDAPNWSILQCSTPTVKSSLRYSKYYLELIANRIKLTQRFGIPIAVDLTLKDITEALPTYTKVSVDNAKEYGSKLDQWQGLTDGQESKRLGKLLEYGLA